MAGDRVKFGLTLPNRLRKKSGLGSDLSDREAGFSL